MGSPPTNEQWLQYLHDLAEWYKDEVQRSVGIMLGDAPSALDSGPNNPPPPPPDLSLPGPAEG